jgi:hypothetical protein
MNYVLVGSPDKISLGYFVKFLLGKIGRGYALGDMHSLMSEEAKGLFVSDFGIKHSKGVFSYYAKGAIARDPKEVLPAAAIELSDAVVWFDLYSTIPIVIKDNDKALAGYLVNWESHIVRIS